MIMLHKKIDGRTKYYIITLCLKYTFGILAQITLKTSMYYKLASKW